MATETQYTVKVPLNPTDLPTINKTVIWNESEGRFNLGGYSDCQLQYIWSTGSTQDTIPEQNLRTSTQNFSINTASEWNFIGLSYTGYPGNDYKSYLSGITSAYFFVTKSSDPNYYMAFQGNLLAQSDDITVFKIVNNTFSSSDPVGSGTPDNGDILCVDIDPISYNSSSGGTVCSNISAITINFTSVTVGDTITFTLPPDLDIQTGNEIRIIYTPNPNIQIVGVVTSYDPDSGPPNTSVLVELVLNAGYTAGNVNENVTCYEIITISSDFIFRRTLFVDMNGDDTIGASVSPVGGILNPPFKTIQGAIDYITTNISSFIGVDVTIHVFAGTYYVSTGAAGDTGPGPIELGYDSGASANTRVHLYLEDGVYIVDNTSVTGGTSSNPVYLFKMQGSAPSITGYGVIKTGGVLGVNYCDVININQPINALIQVKRINHNFRGNIGKTFRHVRSQDKSTEVFFEGEVLIDNVNGALLHNQNSHPNGTLMSFEFGHNSKITIINNDSDAETNFPVVYSGTSTLFIRGDWYHKPSISYAGKIFWYFDNKSVYIFDGADIFLQVTAPNNYFITTSNVNNCVMEVRETSFSNGYVDNTYPITNYSGGFLFQGASIKPNQLLSIYS
jgi:hypothetical protein